MGSEMCIRDSLCAERDISVSTIRRARVALGLKTLYIGNQPNRKNYWYQPELEEAAVVADITNQNQQIQLADAPPGF